MIRRPAVYRRKLKGFLLLCFFSLLIFLGVFSACLGIWFFLHTKTHIITPLPQAISEKKAVDINTYLQSLCVEKHINCTDIHINNDQTATLTIDTDEKVILSLQKDLATQIASLQLTIAHLTIDGRRFRLLDFRFEKPVISY